MSGLIQKRDFPKSIDPSLLLLYGAKKAGKTTMLSELDDCLIIDTEKGAKFISGTIAEVTNLGDLRELTMHLAEEMKSGKSPYKYIAIDTINKVVDWIEEAIVIDHNNNSNSKINYFGDLAFGKGHGMVREKVNKLLDTFMHFCDCLVITGHNKLAQALSENSTLVDPQSLDLTGKLKNMIMAKCDSIGYVFREDEKLKISFEANNALEAGSRSPHLKGQTIDFSWDNIFKNNNVKQQEAA